MNNQPSKQLTVGILAHVDGGKTTLSEGMLYLSGSLKQLGRVDHKNAFLDTDGLERERGITIFSKQAILPLRDTTVTLLDTPGHVDFSAEMERTLPVMDCAILVISGTDGIQGHTETLWRLLKANHIPTFLFINKMDLAGADRDALLSQLQSRLDEGCVDFQQPLGEDAAVCDESLLEYYLEHETVPDDLAARAVAERKLFPCYFGSALKLEGVQELLDGLERYQPPRSYGEHFGARVFKITRDPAGTRLTWMKITGGGLKVKTMLSGTAKGEPWQEKADQLRLYSGARFETTERAEPGQIVAVTGLTAAFAGEGLGFEPDSRPPRLVPVMTYQVILPPEVAPYVGMQKLRELEEEDPLLSVRWDEHLQEIHMQLMGGVQVEVLSRRIAERFGFPVTFGKGDIVYRETIAAPVIGVGHFEPLRHYAEVHLLLEPAPQGSGLHFESRCREDRLDLNWQRLILTHLEEKTHVGVLMGAPITDMTISVINGRAHPKHTEGGDFRQATYRALRQGLRQAESLLLEPWYELELELPADALGRAMSDIQLRSGSFEPPEQNGERVILRGEAPVSEMGDYAAEVMAYTKGHGRMSCRVKGYQPCHNTEQVLAEHPYDPDADVENTADSVFCSHGAGTVVKWNEVSAHQHLESRLEGDEPEREPEPVHVRGAYAAAAAADEELQAIFEQTYGPIRKKRAFESPRREAKLAERVEIKPTKILEEYLLVDGYNIIFAWDELNRLAKDSMDRARQALMDDLCSFQAYRNCHIILVFDAYRVKGGTRHVEKYHNIHVVYTQEAETADSYIEEASYRLGKDYRVRVATSDGMEQIIVMGHGCLRVSAKAFHEEMEMAKADIRRMIRQTERKI